MGGRRKARHKGIGKKRHLKRGIRDLKHRTKDIDQVYETVMANEMELDRSGDGTDEEGGRECDGKPTHCLQKATVSTATVILQMKTP
ncbi:BUD20, bud site selection protein 20 [Babesia caballi]|uniref:BUD20, bud site selection protein 20 n=1 Tax=Babesia caballi TaxID=5871 RepID=A0AAV4M1I0_BABCB|nr:BUD20, bud site selection protein 20 [Babesia caballi]